MFMSTCSTCTKKNAKPSFSTRKIIKITILFKQNQISEKIPGQIPNNYRYYLRPYYVTLFHTKNVRMWQILTAVINQHRTIPALPTRDNAARQLDFVHPDSNSLIQSSVRVSVARLTTT